MTDHGRASDSARPRLGWWQQTWRVALVVAISAVAWLTVSEQIDDTAFVVDVLVGPLSLALMFLRRRHPLTIAVLITVLSGFSAAAAGPATLAAVSLATRRRRPEIVPVAALALAAATLFSALYPVNTPEPWWVTSTVNVLAVGATIFFGMYVGSRRELLWTLRARAERAEQEQELRAAQARLAERARIAREMHDVLAHRISQISMRAGALSYREDLGVEELRAGAAIIRETSHQALTDLRGVLGVLRDESGEVLDAPQPTYADVPELVDEARRGGLRIDYVDDLTDQTPVPEAVGRALYRVVQEGITNARKHAFGARLSVAVHGSPGTGIDVELRNAVGFGTSATPGSGLGLVGLSERAALCGGRVEHGVRGDAFVLRGWLPWST